jgi:hypothetical protein
MRGPPRDSARRQRPKPISHVDSSAAEVFACSALDASQFGEGLGINADQQWPDLILLR